MAEPDTYDVRMPDGTIITNVPSNVTQEDLLEMLGAEAEAMMTPPVGNASEIPPEAAEVPSMLDRLRGAPYASTRLPGAPAAPEGPATESADAFGRSGLVRFLSNLGTIPEEVIKSLMPTGSPPTLQSTPGPFGPISQLALEGAAAAGRAMPGGTDIASPEAREGVTGALSGENVLAAGQLAKNVLRTPGRLMRHEGLPSLSLSGLIDEQKARTARDEARHPTATRLGRIGGDVATVMTGRPFTKSAVQGVRALLPKMKAATRPGVMAQLNKVVASAPVKSLGKGIGKAAEAGIEGAMLAMLDEGDPVKSAALSAGGQMAGSMALASTYGAIKNPKLGATGWGLATVFGGAALWQMMKEMTPGGRDRILESIEETASKAGWALVIGAAASLSGAGRLTSKNAGDFTRNMPIFADAINTVPRAALESLWKDVTKESRDGDGPVGRVLQQFSIDPDYFSGDTLGKLNKGMKEGKLSETISGLLESDPEFAKRYNALPRAQYQKPGGETRFADGVIVKELR